MNKLLTAADIDENTVRAPYSPRILPARPGVLLLWPFASQTA